jgi:hypothetical protein
MSASDVSIVNIALSALGEARILSLDDNLKQAREAKTIYEAVRDSLLAAYNWSFAKTRVQLSALASPPAFGYGVQYQLPTDCLRLLFVNEEYAGLDLTDYRGSPTDLYTIEGRRILTDIGAPLNIRYIKQETDPQQFAPNFVTAFACALAERLAEPLTQSATKREQATAALKREIGLAVRANAIELPPQKLADDEWIVSRL